LHNFADKAIAVDPLDRPLWAEVTEEEGEDVPQEQIEETEI